MPWPRWLRGTKPEPDPAHRRAAFSELREKLPGLRALFVLGPGGDMIDFVADAPGLDIPGFASEYATLLRIVKRACKDAGMGDVQEQILISSGALVLVQHFPNDHFVVFVCSPGEPLGRLRYELKRSLLYSSLSKL
jgi:predicted regulator of Ras-like GTPase activity (Roadblock/LC7/MglB family)